MLRVLRLARLRRGGPGPGPAQNSKPLEHQNSSSSHLIFSSSHLLILFFNLHVTTPAAVFRTNGPRHEELHPAEAQRPDLSTELFKCSDLNYLNLSKHSQFSIEFKLI